MPASYVVHLAAHEFHASGELGHEGGKAGFEVFGRDLRHAQEAGEHDVPGKAGVGAYGQDIAVAVGLGLAVVAVAVLVMMPVRMVAMLMAMVFVVMFSAHRAFTTLAAAQAAP
jgi:hypothetical protein